MSNVKYSPGHGPNTLVLLLHAYTQTPRHLAAVRAAVADEWPEARLLCPELPLSLLSVADPNEIVAGLLDTIDAETAAAERAHAPITNIVLVGHSFGALLARKLYVVACGETPEAPFEPALTAKGPWTPSEQLAARPWAVHVSRLVLLASMNRGWRITHHLGIAKAPVWTLGAAFGHLVRLVSGRTLAISTIRRGAEFITQLRIQWIRMRQAHQRAGTDSPGGATTVQLLGSRDDMVAPEDNIDLVSGGDFIYLDVPYSGHADVIELDDPTHGPARKAVFVLALGGSIEALRKASVVPSDEAFSTPDERTRKVVFVIHGIRDVGYWTHKIARRIRQRAADARETWATETSSYGYFPMLPFLFPWYRRQKVEWLMDQYAEALARYPNAAFSYVGHSNGTYLLAKALELYPCCRFEHVVFAGSVVRTTYDWGALLATDPPRVKAVLNFVASGDWVVAFFPRFFEFLKLQDLGSAGHDGFAVSRPQPRLYQVKYVSGGHAAAIQESMWDLIADFVVDGHAEITDTQPVQQRRSPLVALPGRFPPAVWAFILALVWCIWTLIECLIQAALPQGSIRTFATGFALAAYLVLLWMAVTRV